MWQRRGGWKLRTLRIICLDGDDEYVVDFISYQRYLQRNGHPQRFMLVDYVPLNRKKSAAHDKRKMPSSDADCSIAKQSLEARLKKLGHPVLPRSLPLPKTSWINYEVLRVQKFQSTVARTEVVTQTNTTGEVTLQAVEKHKTVVVTELVRLKGQREYCMEFSRDTRRAFNTF